MGEDVGRPPNPIDLYSYGQLLTEAIQKSLKNWREFHSDLAGLPFRSAGAQVRRLRCNVAADGVAALEPAAKGCSDAKSIGFNTPDMKRCLSVPLGLG